MPGKFLYENKKADESRERKKLLKDTEHLKKQKEEEDAYWKDEYKQVIKKQHRKEEQLKKEEEASNKKAKIKAMLEQEMASLTPSKAGRSKVTLNQINMNNRVKKKENKSKTNADAVVIENVNRLYIDGFEARSATEAIKILKDENDDIDRHPEKRRKAAYNAFEERRIKEIKEVRPNLRLSQIKEIVFKEWQKSAENPFNLKSQ